METVVIEVTLWESGKVAALLRKIRQDARVLRCEVVSGEADR